MDAAQIPLAVTSGTPVKTILNPGNTCLLAMGAFGHISYRILLRGNTAVAVSGGTQGQVQTMLIMIQQAPAGGAEVTWPTNIIWTDQNGQVTDKAPFVDSQAGALTFATLMTLDGGKRYYGRAGF
ncbi:hypothetical protein ACLEIY_06775 [Acetobacter tropicalis]|uniref:hypothetical protein n=1 Tax=Acetobacter TaxID=434 RepID=UPI001EDA31BC|nr:hypothetical protein [Acetobacter senegalensis]MCG4253166.1 hypothetical protein [Acetobacter senegalensis]